MVENRSTRKNLQDAVNRGELFCSTIRFNSDDFFHHLIIGHLLGIVESGSSIVILLEHERVADSKTLLRAILESYVDLRLLERDESHKFSIQLEFIDAMISRLEQAESGNPYAASIKENIDVEAEMISWKEKRHEVEQSGGKKKRLIDKFKLLNLNDDYQMLYRSLSQSAHSTYAGIIDRSFVVNRTESTFEAVLYCEPEPSSIDVIVGSAVDLIDSAIEIVRRNLPVPTHPSSTPR